MPLFWSKKKKSEPNLEQTSLVAMKNTPINKAKSARLPAVSKGKDHAKISVPALPSGTFSSVADSIIRPRITEKSGVLSQKGVYTFVVSQNANKQSVSKAIIALYKVIPTKVNIVNLPAKKVFLRGRKGTVSGIRKAMVTLKQGEKIDFV